MSVSKLSRRDALAGAGAVAGASLVAMPAVALTSDFRGEADAELKALWSEYVEADVAVSYANTYHDGLRVRCQREAQSEWEFESASHRPHDPKGDHWWANFWMRVAGGKRFVSVPCEATCFEGAEQEGIDVETWTVSEHKRHYNENAKHYRLKRAERTLNSCLSKMNAALAAINNSPASTLHGAAVKLAADLTFRDDASSDIPAVHALYRDLTKIIGHDYVADAERRMSAASKKGYADADALPGLRGGPVSRDARKAVRS